MADRKARGYDALPKLGPDTQPHEPCGTWSGERPPELQSERPPLGWNDPTGAPGQLRPTTETIPPDLGLEPIPIPEPTPWPKGLPKGSHVALRIALRRELEEVFAARARIVNAGLFEGHKREVVAIAAFDRRFRNQTAAWETVRPRFFGKAATPLGEGTKISREEPISAQEVAAAYAEVRLCEECSCSFALTRDDARYCSEACSARARNRGRPETRRHRSTDEMLRTQREHRKRTRIEAHAQTCSVCQRGEFCMEKVELELSLGATEPLDCSRGTFEEAERRAASNGQTPKRGPRDE